MAEKQAALFVNLDMTFTALAGVARPFLQETISESPPSEEVAIREFPHQRPFLRNSAAFFRELRPGVATLPAAAPLLADAFESGAGRCPGRRRSTPHWPACSTAGRRSPRTRCAARRQSARAPDAPRCGRRSRFLTPAQTACNYVTLLFRNVASLLSEGDANGTWQRFIIIGAPQGPNNEGGPSRAPANGPDAARTTSTPTPTRTPRRRARRRSARPATRATRSGSTLIGNVPGNQGTLTAGQKGANAAKVAP